MAHLTIVTPPTAKTFIISKTSPRLHKAWACTATTTTTTTTTGSSDQDRHVQRRSMALGLTGVVVGLSVGGGNARAAARRPPPPPPSAEEKKDPNMNGVIAKVVASKKRKEAMKESIAKLREKGKLIQDPSQ